LSFELSDESVFIVIDRGKRNDALEEINFSLSGLSDEKASLDVGRLLTANYMVIGEIIEMDRKFLVTMKLLEVETGAIVWQEQLLTRLNNYESVSRYFAESLTAVIAANSGEAVEVMIPEEPALEETPVSGEAEDNRAESLIAFSAAVDALDEGDREEARKELRRAQSIDPESRVVRHYLDILSVVSPKFNFELRPFGPVYNPAYLPRYDSDKFYFWQSLPMGFLQPAYNYQVSPEISTYESVVVMTAGYLFPLGNIHGLDIAISWTHIISQINTSVNYDFMGQPGTFFQFSPDNWGFILGYGITISRILSLGIAFHPMIVIWGRGNNPESLTFQYSFSAGGLLTFVNGRLLLDFQFIYSQYPQFYAIESDRNIYKGKTPLIFETSIVGSAIPDKLYFSLKGNVDAWYDDRGGYYMRMTAMAEFWPVGFLALRGGYLLSILDQMDAFVVGHGVTAGFTLKFGKWEFDTAYSHSVT
ncbi:MAG: hypothetical protein KAJ98_03625, partial [Spirochaetaceae bacterium]|nr:hypothetical protein [Spirochaetaceae bacterium]